MVFPHFDSPGRPAKRDNASLKEKCVAPSKLHKKYRGHISDASHLRDNIRTEIKREKCRHTASPSTQSRSFTRQQSVRLLVHKLNSVSRLLHSMNKDGLGHKSQFQSGTRRI